MAEGERLAKRLAAMGVASRRDAEKMIQAGRVTVNGTLVTTPAFNVTTADTLTLDSKPLTAPAAQPRLFRFHKPRGVVCTARDERGRPTVFDVLPKGTPRLVLVGRLDLNTEGLLLLTTDGDLAGTLMHPSTGLPRTYRVRAHGHLTDSHIAALAKGVSIDGTHYRPIQAERDHGPRAAANSWFSLTLTEGKKREIRVVLEYLGLTVTRLIRTAYGPFRLADLPVGALDEIPPAEVARFVKTLRTDHAPDDR